MSGDWVEVATQAELDALKPGDVAICRKGHFYAYGSASVTAYDSASVTAYGSASVTAYDSASVRAYDSASVRASGSASVRAYDSASVTAYDSASVTASGSASVTASGSASVRAYGSASVRATPYVAVHQLSKRAKVKGGVLLTPPDTNACDAATWLDYYGITVTKAGYAVLFKAVNDDFQTTRGPEWTYTPGATLTPTRWVADRECGNGLHLCAAPHLSARYLDGATKFVAVKVKAADIVPLGDKVKVPSLKVLHEVDIDGKRVTA